MSAELARRISGRLGSSTPTILQTEAAECGLACLAMVAGHHGHHLDLPAIRRRFTASMRGTTLKDLVRVGGDLRLATRALRLEPQALGALRLPCILHWGHGHFVVLTRVGRRGVDARFRDLGRLSDFDTLGELFAPAPLVELQAATATPPAKCAGCPWWGPCRGGTFTNRYAAANGFDNPSIFCGALASFYNELAAWLVEGGMPYEDIERRLTLAGSAPEAVLGPDAAYSTAAE